MEQTPLFEFEAHPPLIDADQHIGDEQYQSRLARPYVPGQVQSDQKGQAAFGKGQKDGMEYQKARRRKCHVFMIPDQHVQPKASFDPFDPGRQQELEASAS